MTSLARQNYHADSEAAINRQINLELYSSYVYMSMATFFGRDDIALPGFHKYFKKASDEEREHAEKFIKYQNMRGGRVSFQDIQVRVLVSCTHILTSRSVDLEAAARRVGKSTGSDGRSSVTGEEGECRSAGVAPDRE